MLEPSRFVPVDDLFLGGFVQSLRGLGDRGCGFFGVAGGDGFAGVFDQLLYLILDA